MARVAKYVDGALGQFRQAGWSIREDQTRFILKNDSSQAIIYKKVFHTDPFFITYQIDGKNGSTSFETLSEVFEHLHDRHNNREKSGRIGRLEEHIKEICRQHNVTLMWDKPSGRGVAYPKQRLVRTAPIKSVITYVVALHEIGHIVGPRQGLRRLEEELGAWEYARSVALEWTESASKKAYNCLQSYVRRSNRRKRMWTPPEGHDFWEFLNRLEAEC